MLWDLNESKHLYSLTAGDEIHALVFSPNRYWLCAATASSIIIFDLEKKSKVDELKPEYVEVGKKSREPECISLAWSADGQTLFAGYTDNKVRKTTFSLMKAHTNFDATDPCLGRYEQGLSVVISVGGCEETCSMRHEGYDQGGREVSGFFTSDISWALYFHGALRNPKIFNAWDCNHQAFHNHDLFDEAVIPLTDYQRVLDDQQDAFQVLHGDMQLDETLAWMPHTLNTQMLNVLSQDLSRLQRCCFESIIEPYSSPKFHGKYQVHLSLMSLRSTVLIDCTISFLDRFSLSIKTGVYNFANFGFVFFNPDINASLISSV